MFIRLRNLREDNDWTQEYLAKKINCDQSTYSRYESGQRLIPIDVLIKIAKIYRVSVDYLLGISNEKQNLMISEK